MPYLKLVGLAKDSELGACHTRSRGFMVVDVGMMPLASNTAFLVRGGITNLSAIRAGT